MTPSHALHDCASRGFVELIIPSNCLDMTSSFLGTRKNILFVLECSEDRPPLSGRIFIHSILVI